MFYEKKSGLFIPGQNNLKEDAGIQEIVDTFITRTARRIADGVLEKYRTGVPVEKALNIMNNQLAKVARHQKGKSGEQRMNLIKDNVIKILREEG